MQMRMTDPGIHIDIYHREHVEWLAGLDFAEDQIQIFEKELSRVLLQNPDRMPVIEHVEEYRSILDKKMHRVAELREQTGEWERRLGQDTSGAGGGDWAARDMHKQAVEQFFADFETLKNTLRRFVSRND